MADVSLCVKGKKRGQNEDCQDAIFFDTGVYCVADGVSNSKFGGDAAWYLVDGLGTFFSEPSNLQKLVTKETQEIREIVHDKVKESLLNLMYEEYGEKNEDKLNDFATTFLACVRLNEDSVLIIHAGDGMIIGQLNCEGSNIVPISLPDNKGSDSCVYAVAEESQRKRMRVIRLNAKDYKKILLCSDGFSAPYLTGDKHVIVNVGDLADVFLVDKEGLKEIVKTKHYPAKVKDDISVIIYDVPADDSYVGNAQFNDYKDNADKQQNHKSQKQEEKKQKMAEKTKEHMISPKIEESRVQEQTESAQKNPLPPPIEDRSNQNNKTKNKVTVISVFILILALVVVLCNFKMLKEHKNLDERYNEISNQFEEIKQNMSLIESQLQTTGGSETENSTEPETELDESEQAGDSTDAETVYGPATSTTEATGSDTTEAISSTTSESWSNPVIIM